MSLASRQRDSLCDLMSELGPLAPTMCDGWNVGDLAAHLWIREHKPASLPGIGSQRFAELTRRIQTEALHLKGFPALVMELRRPGWVMRPLDGIVNAVEFFVHHEDVLHANGLTQHLTDKDQGKPAAASRRPTLGVAVVPDGPGRRYRDHGRTRDRRGVPEGRRRSVAARARPVRSVSPSATPGPGRHPPGPSWPS